MCSFVSFYLVLELYVHTFYCFPVYFKFFQVREACLFLKFIYLFIYLYCCSSTVFCLFPHSSPSPQPSPLFCPVSTPPCYCQCVLYNCSCKPFTLFSLNSLLCPLCSLSACFQFQCLWLYFACLFVLLIRFLLKVRTHGIGNLSLLYFYFLLPPQHPVCE